MITIDDRERTAHPALVADLQKSGTPTQILRMDFADYRFDITQYTPEGDVPYTVGIELCTPSDLVGKVDSGRLEFQLSGMIERYNVPILLCTRVIHCDTEGRVLIPGNPTKMAYSRLMDILFAAQCHGVIVQFVGRNEDVPAAILRMYRYWGKAPEDHRSFRPQHLVPTVRIPLGEPIDSRVQTLMSIPGVGEDKARALLAHYASLEIIFNLPVELLKRVPGIGQGTAEKIRSFISTPISKPLTAEEIDALATQYADD